MIPIIAFGLLSIVLSQAATSTVSASITATMSVDPQNTDSASACHTLVQKNVGLTACGSNFSTAINGSNNLTDFSPTGLQPELTKLCSSDCQTALVQFGTDASSAACANVTFSVGGIPFVGSEIGKLAPALQKPICLKDSSNNFCLVNEATQLAPLLASNSTSNPSAIISSLNNQTLLCTSCFASQLAAIQSVFPLLPPRYQMFNTTVAALAGSLSSCPGGAPSKSGSTTTSVSFFAIVLTASVFLM